MSTLPGASSALPRVAILGGGVMGGTVVGALISAGWPKDAVVVSEKDPARASALRKAHGVDLDASLPSAVARAGIVVIAVKPQDVAAVLAIVGPELEPAALVVSVAAGLPTSFFEERLPAGTPVIRTMPNTPAIVSHGATAMAPGLNADAHHLALAGAMLRSTGLVVTVDEADLDAVTAVSGSGPAYFYAMVEALVEAGVAQGLDHLVATQLATQTFVGAARLLVETGETPQALRAKVSSPGGTTLAALRALEKAGLGEVILAGVGAASARAKEMALEFGETQD
jgi:pyrroline-5-carboxylate reductase